MLVDITLKITPGMVADAQGNEKNIRRKTDIVQTEECSLLKISVILNL